MRVTLFLIIHSPASLQLLRCEILNTIEVL